MENGLKKMITAGGNNSYWKSNYPRSHKKSSHSTWKPEGPSFLRQMGWSLWGRSWRQVEQNFRTCLETPSGKMKTNLHYILLTSNILRPQHSGCSESIQNSKLMLNDHTVLFQSMNILKQMESNLGCLLSDNLTHNYSSP